MPSRGLVWLAALMFLLGVFFIVVMGGFGLDYLIARARASEHSGHLPAIARIDCATARMWADDSRYYTMEEIRELMTRHKVTDADIVAVRERCNIKTDRRR